MWRNKKLRYAKYTLAVLFPFNFLICLSVDYFIFKENFSIFAKLFFEKMFEPKITVERFTSFYIKSFIEWNLFVIRILKTQCKIFYI